MLLMLRFVILMFYGTSLLFGKTDVCKSGQWQGGTTEYDYGDDNFPLDFDLKEIIERFSQLDVGALQINVQQNSIFSVNLI